MLTISWETETPAGPMPLADTLKRSEGTLRVCETIPRQGLWRAQTPQMFRYGLLRRALAKKPDERFQSAEEFAAALAGCPSQAIRHWSGMLYWSSPPVDPAWRSIPTETSHLLSG